MFSAEKWQILNQFLGWPILSLSPLLMISKSRSFILLQEEDLEEQDKSIVFLYTVCPGPCSKSHGFNAARLAGLPGPIIDLALKVAAQFEEEQNNLLELAQIVNSN